jgi:molecular chaperone GrpE
MENIKKRLEREKTGLVKFANENLVKDLLPVLDNLERALVHGNEARNNQEALLEGVRLTYEGLLNVLEKFGVTPVKALGERFDPNFHEAVMQKDDPDVEDNSVIEEVQKGYLLHDRLIRPSMVVVSRKPAAVNESS